MSKPFSLYGGAISAVLPDASIDVSQFREIPDTQEVYLLEQPNGLDQLIIFDLLEPVASDVLPEVVAVHMEDILDGPARFLAPLESLAQPQLGCEMHTFLVKPAPTKRESATSQLFLFVALLRVERAVTDVVISMNVPVEMAEVTQEVFDQEAQNVHGDSVLAQSYAVMKAAAMLFDIKDWGLFK